MFNQRVIVFLLSSIIAAAVVAEAATVPYLESEIYKGWHGRIVGGNTASPGQFPYQVSMRSAANSHFCGGSILSNNWVMTAAHCSVGRTPANTFVVTNAHHVSQDGTTYSTATIIIYEDYNPYYLDNDISIVQTATEIMFTATVQPIAIGGDTGAGVHARASGWGTIYYNGPLPQYLQWLDLVTLSNLDCRSRHPNLAYLVNDSVICAFSNVHGQGMCHGDSGGPLVANGELVGAVSWGEPCAEGRPDGFVRVALFRGWIAERMSEH